MGFKPNESTFKAAPRICICNDCLKDNGSCSQFSSYELKTFDLKKNILRSDDNIPALADEVDMPTEFILPDSFCAVAPDLENNPANESVWFILVKEILVAQQEVVDDYQNKIPKGVEFIKGHFLEKIQSDSRGILYKLESKKITFFYKETIRSPYVQFLTTKKRDFIYQ